MRGALKNLEEKTTVEKRLLVMESLVKTRIDFAVNIKRCVHFRELIIDNQKLNKKSNDIDSSLINLDGYR